MRKWHALMLLLAVLLAFDAIAWYGRGTRLTYLAAFLNFVLIAAFLSTIGVRRIILKKNETRDELYEHALRASLRIVAYVIIAALALAGLEAVV